MKDRANTYEEKRVVLERLLAAWAQRPTERLTQFICNATKVVDAYYVEDFAVVRAAEERVRVK